jgi:hypothetical protein
LLEGFRHRVVAIVFKEMAELTAQLNVELIDHLVRPAIDLVTCQIYVLLSLVDNLFMFPEFLYLLMEVHDLLSFG